MRFLILIFMIFVSCKKSASGTKFENLIIDKRLNKNDTFKILAKLPEIKNYKNQRLESLTKTSSVIQTLIYTNFNQKNTKRYIHFDNYKVDAELIGDSLNIFINNNNGEFGNGILVKIFDGQYFIKNIDPNTIRNQLKFEDYQKVEESLILNKVIYQKKDSIFGHINYTCQVTPSLTKTMKGYFRTKVK